VGEWKFRARKCFESCALPAIDTPVGALHPARMVAPRIFFVSALFLAGCDLPEQELSTPAEPSAASVVVVASATPPALVVEPGSDSQATRSTPPPADLKLPDASAWGGDVPKLTAAVRRLAGSDASFLRSVQAATILVSRLGQAGDWAVGRRGRSLICAVRAKLMASILRELNPKSAIRLAGMASVPRQGAHSALEVFVPAQKRWGYFDPSSGTFFTRDGTLDGPVVSMAELFARPELVEQPGPFAPAVEREKTTPALFDLGDRLESVARLQPGFTRSNFPLRSMIEEAAAYGAYVSSETVVNPVVLDMDGTHLYDGITEEDGRVRNRLQAWRHEKRGRYVSWLDCLGIEGSGLNVTPSYELRGLEPGRDYLLRLTMTRVAAGFTVRPLPVRGCRFYRRSMRQTLPTKRTGELFVYELRFRATSAEAIILLTHEGTAPRDGARIGRIELVARGG
jgi:hypothetical protein